MNTTNYTSFFSRLLGIASVTMACSGAVAADAPQDADGGPLQTQDAGLNDAPPVDASSTGDREKPPVADVETCYQLHDDMRVDVTGPVNLRFCAGRFRNVSIFITGSNVHLDGTGVILQGEAAPIVVTDPEPRDVRLTGFEVPALSLNNPRDLQLYEVVVHGLTVFRDPRNVTCSGGNYSGGMHVFSDSGSVPETPERIRSLYINGAAFSAEVVIHGVNTVHISRATFFGRGTRCLHLKNIDEGFVDGSRFLACGDSLAHPPISPQLIPDTAAITLQGVYNTGDGFAIGGNTFGALRDAAGNVVFRNGRAVSVDATNFPGIRVVENTINGGNGGDTGMIYFGANNSRVTGNIVEGQVGAAIRVEGSDNRVQYNRGNPFFCGPNNTCEPNNI